MHILAIIYLICIYYNNESMKHTNYSIIYHYLIGGK